MLSVMNLLFKLLFKYNIISKKYIYKWKSISFTFFEINIYVYILWFDYCVIVFVTII